MLSTPTPARPMTLSLSPASIFFSSIVVPLRVSIASTPASFSIICSSVRPSATSSSTSGAFLNMSRPASPTFSVTRTFHLLSILFQPSNPSLISPVFAAALFRSLFQSFAESAEYFRKLGLAPVAVVRGAYYLTLERALSARRRQPHARKYFAHGFALAVRRGEGRDACGTNRRVLYEKLEAHSLEA